MAITRLSPGDPRLGIIEKRLAGIRDCIPVSGGKGGIGKSIIASGIALILAEKGHRVGLADLDFTGPSDHIILGIKDTFPEEKHGLVPPRVHGLRFMSVSYFIGDKPAILRGEDVSNAIIELLAITQWGELDFLVIDMPPGVGDAILDMLRLVPRLHFLLVGTSSLVVMETVKRTLYLLKQVNSDIYGLVENMKRTDSDLVAMTARECGIPYLGAVPFDEKVEDTIGDVTQFRKTAAVEALRPLVESIFCRRESAGGHV